MNRTLHPHSLVFGNFNERKNYGRYPALRICLIVCIVLVILAVIILWFLYSPSQRTKPSKTSNLLPLQCYFCFILLVSLKKKSFDLLSSLICNEIFSSNSALD